jgi:hypothetical protein
MASSRSTDDLLQLLNGYLASMQPPRALTEYAPATHEQWQQLFGDWQLGLNLDERIRLATRVTSQLQQGHSALYTQPAL